MKKLVLGLVLVTIVAFQVLAAPDDLVGWWRFDVSRAEFS